MCSEEIQITSSTSASKLCSQVVQPDVSLHRPTVNVTFAFSNKNLRICILSAGFVMATWLLLLRNIGDDFHTPACIATFCSPTRQCSLAMESTIPETPIYGLMKITRISSTQFPTSFFCKRVVSYRW